MHPNPHKGREANSNQREESRRALSPSGMMTKIGIIIFSIAILAGPFYSVPEYRLVSNTISELGAQQTPHNFFAIFGFLAFGLGIVLDWVRQPSRQTLPFMLFGLSMMIAGIFPHKPLGIGTPYNEVVDSIHSGAATLGGLFITLGFLTESVRTTSNKRRVITLALATLCFFLPLGMFSLPNLQGILQRIMFASVFLWFWFFFPEQFSSTRSTRP